MNNMQMDELCALTKAVRLPSEVRERVLDEAMAADDAVRGTKRVQVADEGRRARRFKGALQMPKAWLRVAAVLVVGIALTIGAVVAGTRTMDGVGSGTGGNSFVLAAYAEGTKGGSDGMRIVPKGFNGLLSWSGGAIDYKTRTVSGSLRAQQSFEFFVEGNNIESLTYRIEGEGLSFHALQNGDVGAGNAREDESGTSFTISYSAQEADREKFTRSVSLEIPIQGEVEKAMNREVEVTYSHRGSWHPWAEVQDQRSDEERAQDDQAMAHESAVISHAFAQALSKGRIVVTATFKDGSTRSKAYVIRPVDDYVARYEEFELKELSMSDSEREGSPRDAPQLLLVSEEEL